MRQTEIGVQIARRTDPDRVETAEKESLSAEKETEQT